MGAAHQFQQVRLFLAENGFAAILKQMSGATLQAIEPARAAAQHLTHHPCDGGISGSQQRVKVVGHQSPCVTGGLGFNQNILHPPEKIVAAESFDPAVDSDLNSGCLRPVTGEVSISPLKILEVRLIQGDNLLGTR